jgi:hypothetical protein
MSLTTIPPAGSPAWREIYPVPPQVQEWTAGPWCPLDDEQLRKQQGVGWTCPVCLAAWTFRGEAARWLPLPGEPPARRRPRVGWVLAGSAATAAGIAMPLAGLDEHLVLALSAVPGLATVAILAAAMTGRARDWVRYRHNTVRLLADGADGLLGEVPDGA